MTGSLEVRNGVYYAVINYKDNTGKYRRKRFATGLKERGNKKEAQLFLNKQLENFKPDDLNQDEISITAGDVSFIKYITDYIDDKKGEVSPITYSSYKGYLNVMKEYFGDKMKLKDITYQHLTAFYNYLRIERKIKNITVKHYAVILSPALKKAYRDNLISKNPYEFMAPLKREKSRMNFYNKDELEELFAITDKTPLKLIVRVAAFYGFRRSELIGLKWEAIDFDKKLISVNHKVVRINGQFYQTDKLKTQASNRTLPLLPEIENMLIERKKEIERNKKSFGRSYNHEYDDYVFVDDIGDLFDPNLVSRRFRKLIRKSKLKYIRFHDLRHSCASLLVASKIPMKNIQEWLGHANFNTTADVYSHLDYSAKYESANAISNALTDNNDNEDLEDEIRELEEMIKKKKKELEEKHRRDSDFLM